ncbi:prepilin-type N-terminal cleavage/methylation domain-containing protein [candidate division WWE3 bacterium]|nr:prepilin-type N-terminal cleavage/methylation domain-containing protein [candidate division WWE3 bacterium]
MLNFLGKEKAGFTLVELLIVVVLLGILSGVVFSVLKPEFYRNQTRDSVRIANVKKLAEAAESFYLLEGYYPDQSTLADSPYVTSWPDDSPQEGDTYTYSSPSGSSFVVVGPASDGGTYEYDSTAGMVEKCDGSGTCLPLTESPSS